MVGVDERMQRSHGRHRCVRANLSCVCVHLVLEAHIITKAWSIPLFWGGWRGWVHKKAKCRLKNWRISTGNHFRRGGWRGWVHHKANSASLLGSAVSCVSYPGCMGARVKETMVWYNGEHPGYRNYRGRCGTKHTSGGKKHGARRYGTHYLGLRHGTLWGSHAVQSGTVDPMCGTLYGTGRDGNEIPAGIPRFPVPVHLTSGARGHGNSPGRESAGFVLDLFAL